MIDLSTNPVIGKYRVLEPIGSGAMASVFRIEHVQLGATYALKVLDGATGQMADRLMREGRVQAGLHHPNVVTVHDVLEVNQQPALVMEYVHGPTLASFILGHSPIPLGEIDRLATGIIRGVKAVHAAGHLHRDLKPQNILLQPSDGEWIPKIADFGLAKVLGNPMDPIQTRTGQILGSPAYMSPEQTLSAADLDPRTDIWSLGAILYELVTARRAFPHRDIVEIFSHIRAANYRDPQTFRAGVPPRMMDAIVGALVPIEDRIPDCNAMLAIWNGQAVLESNESFDRAATTVEDLLNTDTMGSMSPVVAPPEPEVATLPTAAEAHAPPSRGRWLLPGLLLAGALAAGAWMAVPDVDLPDPTPVPSVAPTPPQTAPRPALPTPAPSPQAAPEPAPIIPTNAPATRPTAAPPTPHPVTTEPVEPLPELPTPGLVSVSGDAERIWLTQGSRHFDPGELPPGRYGVSARFPGYPLQPLAGVIVTLAPGDEVTVQCHASFLTCAVRR